MPDTQYVLPGHDRSLTNAVPSFFPVAHIHPRVVISAKEKGTEIVADFSGYRAEDIELSHIKGQLCIKANGTDEVQPDFYERINVEGNLDWKRTQAVFEQEQLIIFVPRDETKQGLKESIPITVKRGDH